MNDSKNHLKNNAVKIFAGHQNCSQSVLAACMKEQGIAGKEADMLLKSAIGFGGGMGHSGQACGAVSGGIMALSLVMGYDGADDTEKKALLYEKVERLVSDVRKRYGTVTCDGIKEAAETIPEIAGQNELEQDICCVDVVGFVADRVGQFLK
ncbi:MAG: C_GCAxxG_C_C family protein [Spirochaetales bacterium]|nr:C_GCAxxG_C_C family protein [Spirochaetales bacterium]